MKELAKYGVKLAASHEFLYAPGREPERDQHAHRDFKDKGVTTFIGVWDPLSPILITRETTRQQWFPEGLVTGTGLSDTTTAGRLYDGLQWSSAFGISPLWVTWENVSTSGGVPAAHHGDPAMQPGDEGVLVNIYAALVGQLFVGVHMAGPNLTPRHLRARDVSASRRRAVSRRLRSCTSRARIRTPSRTSPRCGSTPTARGPDERGDQGTGMMVKANSGKRYKPGQWPRTEPKAFVENGKELDVSDNPPGGGDLQARAGRPHAHRCVQDAARASRRTGNAER